MGKDLPDLEAPYSKHKNWRRMVMTCDYCEKEFRVTHAAFRKAGRQNQGRAYCSKECGGLGGGGHSGALTRKPWMNDEQWYWEKRLSDEGLGEFHGCHHWLLYGEIYRGEPGYKEAVNKTKAAGA